VTVAQGVGGVPSVSVQRGPKRSDIRFEISHYWNGTDHHISVVPSDAQALLAAGRLDSRLFDVTELLKDGYGVFELERVRHEALVRREAR
jgi:hypothetical protein